MWSLSRYYIWVKYLDSEKQECIIYHVTFELIRTISEHLAKLHMQVLY